MKIYRITVDPAKFQWIIPDVPDSDTGLYLLFECERKAAVWNDVHWYVFNPKKIRGNFFTIGNDGGFAFDEAVYNSDLFEFLEMAGEILPIKVDGIQMYLLNVVDCVNCLDQERTTWDVYDDGRKGRILNHSFHTNRLTESPLFKIPETCRTEILTYSGLKDAEDEFYSRYKTSGFKGLTFDEIFSF